MYQNVTEGKFRFFDKKSSGSSEFYFLEPGFHPSITESFEVMETSIQERLKHRESCITAKVLRRTQKVEI